MPALPTTSGNAPPVVLMTGTPQAMASPAGRPKPSYNDGTTAAQALAAANKRVSNILAKQGEADRGGELDPDLLQEPAENALAEAIREQAERVSPLFAEGRYGDALSSLADLRECVDRFFDEVMVMAEDDGVRRNRLALLTELRNLFLQVADISLLQSAN